MFRFKVGNIKVEGTDEPIDIEYEWNPDVESEYPEPAFRYQGELYFISEFTKGKNIFKNKTKTFHAYLAQTAWHGLLITLAPGGEQVWVYHYGA